MTAPLSPGSPVAGRRAPSRVGRLPGPTITETQFLAQVCEVAELYGWRWAHFRPAKTAHGWRTPVSGPLGKGWPDLVLVRDRDGRMIFAELKSGPHAKYLPEQVEVLTYLRRIERLHGWLTVAQWTPDDFDVIVEILT